MSLSITNLQVTVAGKPILHGISLVIQPGEVHVVMGPNGSGKSTLANALMGHPTTVITNGTIMLDGIEITALSPDKRARQGLFLSQQYPPELPGVSMAQFLRLAATAITGTTVSPLEFNQRVKDALREVGLKPDFASRAVHAGFSGGEKKRAEVAQLHLLNPRYAILDEIDSGLDVDGLKAVTTSINRFRNPAHGLLIITHHPKLLTYLVPDVVHILNAGRIIESGDKTLAQRIEAEGYGQLT